VFFERKTGWYTPQGLDITLSEDDVLVHDGVGSVKLPPKIVQHVREELGEACVNMVRDGDNNPIVVVNSLLFGEGDATMTKMDPGSGAVIWESKVFAGIRLGAGTSGATYYQAVTISEDVVAVFGYGQLMAFVEAFDLNSGDPLLRFSTSYLLGSSEKGRE
jgi:hypothetical protein